MVTIIFGVLFVLLAVQVNVSSEFALKWNNGGQIKMQTIWDVLIEVLLNLINSSKKYKESRIQSNI